MVPLLTVERGIIGIVGFIGLLLAERLWPFRRPLEPLAKRYGVNLTIAGFNALVLSVCVGGAIFGVYRHMEDARLGLLHFFGIGGWANVLCTVLALDGITYLWHRAYHKVPLMWRMHRVHHSDLDLDVTSSGRFHISEMGLSAVFRLGVICLLGADLASVVIFEIVFGMANQLEHANLHLPEPLDSWLRTVFVTPDMHRIHHSQVVAETNSNYSTIFSFWDRLFQTYRFGADQQALTIGLPEYQRPEDVTLARVLALPFGAPCASRQAAPSGVSVA